LRSNEVLLVAGKGHEKTQDYGNKIINFSDKKVIREIINKRKFSFKKDHYQDFLLKKIFNISNEKIRPVSGALKIPATAPAAP